VTLPVFFNEPLSMLQRMCEDIEYIEVLSLAGSEASLLRIMLVAAYAMSNYSSTVGRVNKPFNPVLGETYELVREDKSYRYLSEQVCHHPPISACHCESPDFTFWTEVNVKSKFWGKSLEIHPLGSCHVRLPLYAHDPNTGEATLSGTEHYSWKKVTTQVNNLIVGKLWIDHYGDMVIRNWRTGEECVVTFKPKGGGGSWFGWGSGGAAAAAKKKEEEDADGGGGGDIVGVVKDRTGAVRWELSGRWDDRLTATRPGSPPITLWKRHPPAPNASKNFNFTRFATTLNELTPSLRGALPLTDSRLRPDQRAMEHGEWDAANKGKERIELLQRERRKGIDRKGGIAIGENWWIPRWFVRELDPDTREEHWRFTEDYWRDRAKAVESGGAWPEWVLDVFGLEAEA
ncbi:Oxysterol-binding protein, partial [Blyttiomyces helicus]